MTSINRSQPRFCNDKIGDGCRIVQIKYGTVQLNGGVAGDGLDCGVFWGNQGMFCFGAVGFDFGVAIAFPTLDQDQINRGHLCEQFGQGGLWRAA